MTVPRGVGREHADLTVRDRAGRAGVLAMYTARGFALLEKASLVENQSRVRVGQGFQGIVPHDVAQGIRIPASATKHGLLTPGPGIARSFRPHPTGLAPLRAEQSVQE